MDYFIIVCSSRAVLIVLNSCFQISDGSKGVCPLSESDSYSSDSVMECTAIISESGTLSESESGTLSESKSGSVNAPLFSHHTVSVMDRYHWDPTIRIFRQAPLYTHFSFQINATFTPSVRVAASGNPWKRIHWFQLHHSHQVMPLELPEPFSERQRFRLVWIGH